MVPHRHLILQQFCEFSRQEANKSVLAEAALNTLRRKYKQTEWNLFMAAAFVNPTVATFLDKYEEIFATQEIEVNLEIVCLI